MVTERATFRRLENLFGRAVALTPNERETFIRQQCGDNAELADKLRRMLSLDAAGTRSVMSALDSGDAALTSGERVGPYHVLRVLGHGGMGTVCLASRADEAYDMQVAIKVVRDRLSPDLVSRFRTERQILATLEHPNIARLLDGGETDEGFPYVVMEFVDGIRIDHYCDEHAMRVRERLELFSHVCSAVQYIHRNLIVHRDIKPSNILVTNAGTPKLLDFGIAKLLDTGAIGRPVAATRSAERLLTPDFASPEQIRGESITTSSDVYSLGLLLYHMLTGRTPFPSMGSDVLTAARAICEQEPERPSSAVARTLPVGTAARVKTADDIARARSTPVQQLSREIAGDLDAIVLTALRKEPERRYASAEALRDDLRRYREGRPVAARTDSFAYRTGKFVRRNRLAVAASGAIALALVATTAISTNFAYEADRQARIANAVVDFLRNDLLGRADPHAQPDRNITLSAVLDRAASAIGDRFEHEPVVKAALRSTLGDAYLGLGEAKEALQHYEAAYAIRVDALGPLHAETVGARSAIVDALIEAGAYDQAAEIVPELLVVSQRELGAHHPVTLTTLKHAALVHDGRGDYEAALTSMRIVVDAHEAALGAEDRSTLTARNDLALMLADAGRHEEAEPMLRAVLDARRAVLGSSHPDTLLSIASLGYALSDAGRDAEAEVELRDAVALARETLGDDHPRTAAYLFLLATALRGQNRLNEAEPVASEALAIRRAQLGDDHPETLMSLTLQASLLQDVGQLEEALALLRERYELGIRANGRQHPSTLIAANNIANILLDMKRPDEAQSIAAETVALARRGLPEGYWLIGAFETNHGRALLELGRFDEAEAVLRSAEKGLATALGPDHARVQRVQELMAALENRQ